MWKVRTMGKQAVKSDLTKCSKSQLISIIDELEDLLAGEYAFTQSLVNISRDNTTRMCKLEVEIAQLRLTDATRNLVEWEKSQSES